MVVYSWNVVVIIRAAGIRSGRKDLVEHLYKEAGLILGEDLARLDRAKRIRPDAKAVELYDAQLRADRGN